MTMTITTSDGDGLFELLPFVHRLRDEDQGHALRDLLRVIGRQVEVVESDIARLYDNWFVETADDWVLPYIADLVGWTPVADAGPLATATSDRDLARNAAIVPRRDVANTMRHRRRKGTASLLADLAADVAGWPGLVVECYRLLRYAQHVNHVYPDRGRTVDVRDSESLELIDTPRDTSAHTVDVRRVSSRRTVGLHNIPSVALFVWRLRAYPVTATPASVIERGGRSSFTMDALGFDVPLFAPDPFPEPISRRRFDVLDESRNHRVADDLYGEGNALCIWAPDWPAAGQGSPVPPEAIIPADLSQWDQYRPKPGTVAVDPVLGRMLFPRHQPPESVRVSYHYGFSADIGGGEYERRLARLPVVADDGSEAEPWIRRVADGDSLLAAFDAWQSERPARAVIELTESDVYVAAAELDVAADQVLIVRAANRARPVLWLADRRPDRPDSLSLRLAPGASVTLDGLMVAGRAVHARGVDGPGDGECVAPARLDVRHCTLVPGWLPDTVCEPEAPAPPALELVDLGGAIVDVRHSIVGTVQVLSPRQEADPVRLHVADSIVDATSPGLEAIAAAGPGKAHAALRVERSTVFGQVLVHSIELAENSIFEGRIEVARRRRGCMRFCSVVPGSRTPRRFHCQPDLAIDAGATEASVIPRFTSTHYADAGYAQLSCSCPDEIRRGADDRSEMGAFHDLYQPQRLAALEVRADEYTPAAMNVGVIEVT